MKRIVKPDILDQGISTTHLHAVKYKEPANSLRLQKFDIGYLAGASMKELLRKKSVWGHCFIFEINWLHLYALSSARS